MKTIKEALADWSGKASIATGCLLLSLGFNAAAQPFTTPGGTVWDCVLSGSRKGLAQLLFTPPDGGTPGTLYALELIVPNNKTPNPNTAVDSRGTSGDSRQGSGTNSTGGGSFTNLFGAALFTGQWNFDIKGRIIGNLSESTAPISCVTNTVIVSTTTTNDGTITTTTQTNTTVECSGGITNGYSFTASVSMLGRTPRLTLLLRGSGGQTTYRGVPAADLPDASGQYYGDFIQSGRHNTEFLSLTPMAVPPFDANVYSVTGNGPSYSYTDGIALVSAWKKIGFEMVTDPTNVVVRATVGSINTNKFTAKTGGLQQTSEELLPGVVFKVTRYP